MKGGVNWRGRIARGLRKRVEIIDQFSGERRVEFEAFPCARMDESDARGMEEISAERRQSSIADPLLAGRAVNCIAYYRASKCGKMDANLVRAARMEVCFHEREIADVSERTPVGAGFAAFAAACGHSGAAMKIARNGKFDAA